MYQRVNADLLRTLSYPALCNATWSQTAKMDVIKLENKLHQLIFIEVTQIKPKDSLSYGCLSELRNPTFSCLQVPPLSDNLPAVWLPVAAGCLSIVFSLCFPTWSPPSPLHATRMWDRQEGRVGIIQTKWV